MDIAGDIMSQVEACLEQAIIIVLSLHLGEPLVLDITMLSFISLPYTVLHQNFHFFYLIASKRFISSWQSYDSRYNDWLFWFFFLSWNLHVLLHVSLQLLGPWIFLQIPCLEDSNFFLSSQDHGCEWTTGDTLRLLEEDFF